MNEYNVVKGNKNCSANELSILLDTLRNTLRQVVTEYNLSHKHIVELIHNYIQDFSLDLPEYRLFYTFSGDSVVRIHTSFHDFLLKHRYSISEFRNMVLYIESYGANILSNHPKLKEVLYIYELQDMETLSSHVRRVIEYQHFLENIRMNKEYIAKHIINSTINERKVLGTHKAYAGLLYLPNVEFCIVITNYTLESIKEIYNYCQEQEIESSLQSERKTILTYIPCHREDVYNDMMNTFGELYKKEWFKRKGPFFDLFERYPNTDPGVWNSQPIYDSLGIQYLITKAYEQDFKPIVNYNNDVLRMAYLRFGMICAFVNSENIGIIDIPHYYDHSYISEKNVTIVSKFIL